MLRTPWIEKRSGIATPTQMYFARQGLVTEEMDFVAKRENLSPEEAGIALSKLEEDFWASKTGQKLIRDRVERVFPEFIARVPAGMMSEMGLKRHYKTPEPIKILRKGKG